jgi:hypothetical protein
LIVALVGEELTLPSEALEDALALGGRFEDEETRTVGQHTCGRPGYVPFNVLIAGDARSVGLVAEVRYGPLFFKGGPYAS